MSDDVIGVRRRRPDGEPRVRGATRFGADEPAQGLLHARLVLSYEAHARIGSIDTEAAREVAGVVAVLTADDLPLAGGGTGRSGEPLAREEVVYAGQPVVLVVAETEGAAEDGVDAVVVDYEPLEPVLDLEAALEPDAPRWRVITRASAAPTGTDEAHAAVGGGDSGGQDEPASPNVADTKRLHHGDVDAELENSAARASARFETPWVYQAYVEPVVATAWVDPGGDISVLSSTQGIFESRKEVAGALGLPLERVRVRGTTLGGGFGGKQPLFDSLVAAAALKVGRPVRLALTRTEDFSCTNPAPAQVFELEAGATADGVLTAVRGRILVDRGANDEYGLEMIAAMLTAGPYRWRANDLTAHGVNTNRVPPGAYRAPTAPPAAFAIESVLDDLARQLELDPLELRMRNVMRAGDKVIFGRCPTFGGAECLEAVREHPLWQRRDELPPGEGVGLGVGWWPGGLEPASAVCRLNSDGGVTIITGAVDMSGTETTFATIAAAAFGVAPDQVRVVAADTATAAFSGMSGGSKITYTVGRAVEQAAREAREKLLQVAASELEISEADLEIADGEIRPKGAPARALKIADVAAKVLTYNSPHPPVEGHAGIAQTTNAPAVAAHLSHVRVDFDTGKVQVLGHVIAQDVGRALNPDLVEGQMHGGVAQGIGWALFEQLAHDDAGQLLTGSFVNYAIPGAEGLPPIETIVVEVPAPDGPFGAKGVGEAPVVGVPAAVAAAVEAAAGARIRELPLTPERVWRAAAPTP